jgi:hypothetical protein
VVSLTFLAVVGFLWVRRRRMKLLDQNPESLFGNRELILGPALGSLGERSRNAAPQAADCDPAAPAATERLLEEDVSDFAGQTAESMGSDLPEQVRSGEADS